MKITVPLLRTVMIFGVCLIAFLALSIPTLRAEDSGATNNIKRVDPSHVCMITNKVYDTAQIPVIVGDKTYYGCCEMCEEKLKTDPGSRTAVDPVSGEQVDKSEAVIGAAPDGSIIYFATVENLTSYNAGINSKGNK